MTAEERAALYQGYSPDDPDDKIVREFTAKYGRPPARITRVGGCALAGPVTADEWKEAKGATRAALVR